MLMLEDKYGTMINLLNKFIKDAQFFGPECCNDYCPEIENLKDYLYWHRNNLTVGQGASKVALISNDLNYVLKIPFSGRTFSDYDYNTDEVIEENWQPFECGGGSDSADYCALEVEVYEMALEHGIEQLFAKTEYMCNLKCGIPVYKQLRVVTFADSSEHNASPQSLAAVKSKDKFYYGPCDIEWMALVIDHYGEQTLEKFIDFIDNICPYIGQDLHRSNYGYTLDGKPILLDYSGYMG